jgi:ABC-type cobalamin/Fe3+-siderophores transport system ATPase subunit
MTSENLANPFVTAVSLLDGNTCTLPVGTDAPLFIVGPNGVGKSALMLKLFHLNHAEHQVVRVAAHRQTWMESNAVPFAPAQRAMYQQSKYNEEASVDARWKQSNSEKITGLILANVVDAENALARQSRSALQTGDIDAAKRASARLSPLDTINILFSTSGIPISLSLDSSNALVASRNGGDAYSIAQLSDGERAALLIAGEVLTSPPSALILIDEPERHLHSSIVTPLLAQLLAMRADCTFVVSTHELGLPLSHSYSRTALVRGANANSGVFTTWDIDLLQPGIDIDEETKRAVLGARRKMLFIEGTETSLDKPLYELLFPGVSIFPREDCNRVEHAVRSIADSSEIVWVKACGIVDQDQLTPERKTALEARGVFPLSVYSVEALYYHPDFVAAVATNQADMLGLDAAEMEANARNNFLKTVSQHVDRMAARMTEQIVKDTVSQGMLDWKKIRDGEQVNVQVDAQSLFSEEKLKLRGWIEACDVENILTRYPVRETPALGAIPDALQFKGRAQYEAALRRQIARDKTMRAQLQSRFGGLIAALEISLADAPEVPVIGA